MTSQIGEQVTIRLSLEPKVDADEFTEFATFGVGRLMLFLTFSFPLAVLLMINLVLLIFGRSVEPVIDSLIEYVVLLFASGAAALAILAGCRWTPALLRSPKFVTHILAGAMGSAFCLTLADAADDYFTPGGIGWIWPTVGLTLGALFGATFVTLKAILND